MKNDGANISNEQFFRSNNTLSNRSIMGYLDFKTPHKTSFREPWVLKRPIIH